MRTLHVAAMPFPTLQGTQALIGSMLEAQVRAGRDVELLTYPHGGMPHTQSFALRRSLAVRRGRSLRSGPSLEKLALDLGLVLSLERRVRAFRPHVVIAHHVEAALAALLACRAPVVYFAHTSLEHELPCYFPAALGPVVARAGALFERALCRRAAAVLAVSPLLAGMLSEAAGVSAHAISLPWSVPPPISRDERSVARRALGLAPDELVLGYAGNLDAYQGLATLVEGLSLARREGLVFTWLVATASPVTELAPLLTRAALADRVRFLPLAGEQERRNLHAASDLVLVPRATPGGLPMKLLDALARGVPVLAAERALAGLPGTLCRSYGSDDAAALCANLCEAARQPAEGRARARLARAHLARAHAGDAFVAALEHALATLAPGRHGFPG